MTYQPQNLSLSFDSRVRLRLSSLDQSSDRGKRNALIFSGFHGLEGGPGTTLEHQGVIHGGLTRESVRQIVSGTLAKLPFSEDDRSHARSIIRKVEKLSPCSLNDLALELRREGHITPEIENPSGIISLSYLVTNKKPDVKFPSVDSVIFVTKKNQSSLVEKVQKESSKIVGKYGMTSVSGILHRLNLKQSRKNRDFVSQVISASNRFSFVADDWFTGYPGYVDRLSRRLDSVFSVYEKVDLERLYHVLSRSMRQIKESVSESPEYKALGADDLKRINEARKSKGQTPLKRRPYTSESKMRMAFPIDVFEAFLTQFYGIYSIKIFHEGSRKQVVSRHQVSDVDIEPGAVVSRVVDVLSESSEGSMRESDIRSECDFTSREWYTFITAGNFSPLLSRESRGSYRLVGTLWK